MKNKKEKMRKCECGAVGNWFKGGICILCLKKVNSRLYKK